MVGVFPKDIWIIVFRFLGNDKGSLGNCMRVCKAFNNYINNSRDIMIGLFLKDYHALNLSFDMKDRDLIDYIKGVLQKEKVARKLELVDVQSLTKIPSKKVNDIQIFDISLPGIPADKCIFDLGRTCIYRVESIYPGNQFFIRAKIDNGEKINEIKKHFNLEDKFLIKMPEHITEKDIKIMSLDYKLPLRVYVTLRFSVSKSYGSRLQIMLHSFETLRSSLNIFLH